MGYRERGREGRRAGNEGRRKKERVVEERERERERGGGDREEVCACVCTVFLICGLSSAGGGSLQWMGGKRRVK